MKNELAILCIEDEPDVLDALVRDLAAFEDYFLVETASDVNEAEGVLDRLRASNTAVGLIFCDHILPGKNGVDFLVELHKNPDTRLTRKVLFTGQAGLEATVTAVNRAGLHYYIAKPWNPEEVVACAREQLTRYVIQAGLNPLPYMKILDTDQLSAAIARRDFLTDR